MKKLLLVVLVSLSKLLVSQNWTNGMNALYTLGSTSPSSSGTISTTANTFGPIVAQVCFAIDAKHNCMYVADFFGNRVLRFSYPITSNLPSANLVIGQANFINSASGGLTQTGLNYPQGLAVDTASGTLWILSQGQNRVLRFDGAHTITVNNPLANQVLGQTNFTSGAGATTQSGFNFNTGPQCANLLHFDQLTGALWVSDNGNNRILRFDNAKNLTNGAPANAVLGQALFTTNASGLSATQYSRPDGITTIGSSLYVADPPNNRVLRYDNVYSKPNGAAADAVYGQNSFNTNTGGISATSLNDPTGLTSDQNTLFVSELDNSRVLIYNSANTNTVANNVLMAPNLTTVGSAAATPSTGGSNTGIAYDAVNAQLFVQDRNNSRVLVFQNCPIMSINSPTAICSGQTVTLTGSGANTYTWNTTAITTSISVSPTITSVYSFTGSTAFCNSVVSKTIVVNSLPTVTIVNQPGTVCPGNSATLTASGANTYSWLTMSNTASVVVNPTVNTTYSVVGMDSNGCESTSITNVTVVPNPTLNVISSSSVLCLGQTATLTATGAGTYSWSTGSTNFNIIISPSVTTSYSITGYNGTCFSSSSFTQTVANCTGISERSDLNPIIEVFPNPGNGIFFVNLNSDTEIEVINATGKLVLKSVMVSGKQEIDLSSHADGIYFIRAKYGDKLSNIKIIKTN